MIEQLSRGIMGKVEVIYKFELTRWVNWRFNYSDLTQKVFLDGDGLFLKEYVRVYLKEVLEDFIEWQVAVCAEELQVEIPLSHLTKGYNAAFIHIADAEAADFLTSKLMLKPYLLLESVVFLHELSENLLGELAP